jgi:hypothetical protein
LIGDFAKYFWGSLIHAFAISDFPGPTGILPELKSLV